MSSTTGTLLDAFARLTEFRAGRLTTRIGAIEGSLRGASARTISAIVSGHGIDDGLLESALAMKRAAAQIDVVMHALGIALALPKLLEPGENVEYVSLGAGNTGRRFDLETNRRVAEFKFINWQGGSETIRQNGVFKDFYQLAEYQTSKRRQLFVVDTDRPLRFLRGRRSLKSVLSKNVTLWNQFRERYQNRFERVGEYFAHRETHVEICDVSPFLPLATVDSERAG